MPVLHALQGLGNALVDTEGRPRRLAWMGVLTVCYFFFVSTWLAISWHAASRSAVTLWLPGESRIPFVPEFYYLYATTYILPFLAVHMEDRPERLGRLVLAVILGLCGAFAVYLAMPVTLPRPQFAAVTLAEKLVALQYHDLPRNHFPSLHVTTSWLFFYSVRGARRRWLAPVVGFLAIGVTLATLFVKQHYIVDGIAGIVLATAAWYLAGRLWPRMRPWEDYWEDRWDGDDRAYGVLDAAAYSAGRI